MRKRVYVSDFNMVNPTDTPRGNAPVSRPMTCCRPVGEPTGFEREIFPALVTNPNNTAVDPETHESVMTGQAGDRMQDEESTIFPAMGVTKKASLMAGRKFRIVKDDAEIDILSVGIPNGPEYLITQISFAAYENTYGHTVGSDILNWFDSPIRWIYSIFKPENKSQALYFDATNALASGGLSNWVQSQNVDPLTHYP